MKNKYIIVLVVYSIVLLVLCKQLLAVDANADDFLSGLDVSVYQGDIDFDEVKSAGISAVYIRAGYGNTITDSRFKENYTKAEAAGVDFGFYYFVTATTTEEAKSQAIRFANLISGLDYTMRPAMDFESFGSLTKEEINTVGLAFIEELNQQTGVLPVIYTDANNVENTWNTDFSKYPLWVAAYEGLEDPSEYQLPENDVWTSWVGYQYADDEKVNGISGNVDGDIYTSGVFLSSDETDSVSNKDPIDDPISSDPYPITRTLLYVVQSGDTLWDIAQSYNTTVSEIVAYNQIANPNLIYPGEELHIPEAATSETSVVQPTVTRYIVQSGDTLWDIAQEYQTTVNAIATYNNIENPNLIYPNQVLLIQE